MCLITFAYNAHPAYKLLLIANRDEFYNRPTALAEPWPGNPSIVGGRDLQAGGSWLAVSNKGRFAAVTNFREGVKAPAAESRGQLVSDFLLSEDTPKTWVAKLKPRYSQFNGFNLLIGNKECLYYLSNRSAFATALIPGIYSLSNHLLDSPWPKAVYAKKLLKQHLINGRLSAKELTGVLSRKEPFADNQLPETGVSLEMERTLSAPFIQTKDYGTRCTTVISWLADSPAKAGEINFYELNYLNNGNEQCFREYSIAVR